MLTFNKFPLEDSNKDVIAVRRQATCSFINLCKQDSDHLLASLIIIPKLFHLLVDSRLYKTFPCNISILKGLLVEGNENCSYDGVDENSKRD